MKRISLSFVLLSTIGVVASAQNVRLVTGRYVVSEVCNLVEDTSYRECEDYTITLEAWQDSEYDIRFLIPVHGIPDFVRAKSINDSKFSFSQTFSLDGNAEKFSRFLNIEGSGQVQQDSLLMEYVLMATGTYGSLQCIVKGVRENLDTEGKKAVSSLIRLDIQRQVLLFQNNDLGKFFDFVLFDANGRTVLMKKNAEGEIDVSHLLPGVYVYRITKGNRLVETGKVIKGR